jgi:hypothetical protein
LVYEPPIVDNVTDAFCPEVVLVPDKSICGFLYVGKLALQGPLLAKDGRANAQTITTATKTVIPFLVILFNFIFKIPFV